MKALEFFIVASVLATGLVGNSYAHTMEVFGDYKVEIGWMNEPPIAGIDNVIELVVTLATEFDKQQAMEMDKNVDMDMDHEHMDETTTEEEDHMDHEHEEEGEGVEGLEDNLHVRVILGGDEIPLEMKATDFPGVYHGAFMPSTTGFPIVRISATIGEEEIVDFDMHPEEIEPLSTLAPLHQIKYGISPSDVECKEGFELYMKTYDDTPVCISSASADVLLKRGWLTLF